MAPPLLTKKTPPPAAPPPTAWADSDFESSYPYLSSFLASCSWDDGTRRTTGTLLFFTQDGSLKACLKDRESNTSAFLTAPTFEDLLIGLEAGLAESTLSFKPSRSPG